MTPTGIEIVDRLLGGGHEAGKVHGLLGVMGVGKTTMAASFVAEGALAASRTAGQATNRGPMVFVTLEEPGRCIYQRMLSHLGKIARSSLRVSSDTAPLSTRQNLKDYEQAMLADFTCAGLPWCETERLQFAHSILESHSRIIDLSDGQPVGDPMRAIAAAIDGPIGGLVLDYVGLAARWIHERRDLPMNRMSGLIVNFAEDLRNQIAIRHNCPVWAIGQLNSAASTKLPGKSQYHHDAMDCRRLGPALDAALVMGVKDRDSHSFVLACTKSLIATEPPQPIIVRIHDLFASVCEDVDHAVDPTSMRIVPIDQSQIWMDDSTKALLEGS